MATLTAAQRDALPEDAFAIPEKREYPYRHLPGGVENNRRHAADALARVHHYGTPEERERVEGAVYAEYPDMKAGRHGNNVVVSDGSGSNGAKLRHRDKTVGVKVYRKREDA